MKSATKSRSIYSVTNSVVLILILCSMWPLVCLGQRPPLPDFSVADTLANNTWDFKWGDYDGNGNLDIISTNSIYRNTGNGFAEVFADTLQGDGNSSVEWGDFDHDGDLDILHSSGFGQSPAIYRNTGTGFEKFFDDIFPILYNQSASWADFDNDGDLDILLTGSIDINKLDLFSRLYENTGSGFREILKETLQGFSFAHTSWGDFDKDGLIDLLIAGQTDNESSNDRFLMVYRNTAGGFEEILKLQKEDSFSSPVEWGDVDNDGDLDILIANYYSTKVYVNSNSDFSLVINIDNNLAGSVKWVDFDSDGDLDIAKATTSQLIVYVNTAGVFERRTLLWLSNSSSFIEPMDWGDIDNDGDLDVGVGKFIFKRDRNNTINSAPTVPSELATSTDKGVVRLSWKHSQDNNPPFIEGAGLSYNVYIRKGKDTIVVANSYPDGKQKIPRRGNTQYRDFFLATGLAEGAYQWSVQAVDPSYNGSAFAEENTFIVSPKAFIEEIPTSLAASPIMADARDQPVLGFALSASGRFDFTALQVNMSTLSNEKGRNFRLFFSQDQIFTPTDNLVEGAKVEVSQNIIQISSFKEVISSAPKYFFLTADIDGFVDERTEPIQFSTSQDLLTLSPKVAINPLSMKSANYSFKSKQTSSGILVRRLPYEVGYSSCAWGDYDSDGDLDIFLTGHTQTQAASKILKNIGSRFVEEYIGVFPDVYSGSGAWGDFNSDGKLDILLSGLSSAGAITQLFQNTGTGFKEVYQDLFMGVSTGTVAWGDYDNDGDLDILLSGLRKSFKETTKIYQNTSPGFKEVFDGTLTGISNGTALWGDYDNDGDLDIFLTGKDSLFKPVTKLFQNQGDKFTVVENSIFENVLNSSASWGDYDNDGDLDLALCGKKIEEDPAEGTKETALTAIYQNTLTGFKKIVTPNLAGVDNGSINWADFDSDGDLDLLLSGEQESDEFDSPLIPLTKLYRNTNATFTELFSNELSALSRSASAWGDYDNDGKLDVLITGVKPAIADSSGQPESYVYQFPTTRVNKAPAPPVLLKSTVSGKEVELSWESASDAETSQQSLTYNLYIRNGTDTLLSAQSLPDGKRKIPSGGNRGFTKKILLKNFLSGTFHWSIQAIDGSWTGSSFAVEQTFKINSAPTLKKIIPDQFAYADMLFSFSLDQGYFVDADGDAINYSVSLTDGQPLPAWLTFNSVTAILSGKPPASDLKEYSLKVTASDKSGEKNEDEFIIKVMAVTAVERDNRLLRIKVYPNPASTSINIQFDSTAISKQKQIIFLDVLGKPIVNLETYADFVSIPVAQLANGVYFVQVGIDKRRFVTKIIKMD